jgi:hypothetical protein
MVTELDRYIHSVAKSCPILEKLILKFPKKNWDWESLSRNSSITIEFIANYRKEFPWNWEEVSLRRYIIPRYLNELDQLLDWLAISIIQEEIPLQFIYEHCDDSLNWSNISQYSTLNIDVLRRLEQTFQSL